MDSNCPPRLLGGEESLPLRTDNGHRGADRYLRASLNLRRPGSDAASFAKPLEGQRSYGVIRLV